MSQPIVFVSYSHKDEEEKNQLISHLQVLEKAGEFKIWVDDHIQGGEEWAQAIKQAITRTSVAILLISANSLTSDYILSEEVKTFQERGVTIFPVIAKPCAWRKVSWLAKINVKPKNGVPVWREGGRYADEELALIAQEIAEIVKKKGDAPPPPAGSYNLRAIRKLLTDTFSEESLRTLCYDMPKFRSVYEQFSAGMTRTQMIQLLLEFSERKGLLDDLLAAAREESPAKYAQFESGSGSSQVDELITLKTRRLYELQKKAAMYGLNTPPEIAMEIEDLQTEIAELKRNYG